MTDACCDCDCKPECKQPKPKPEPDTDLVNISYPFSVKVDNSLYVATKSRLSCSLEGGKPFFFSFSTCDAGKYEDAKTKFLKKMNAPYTDVLCLRVRGDDCPADDLYRIEGFTADDPRRVLETTPMYVRYVATESSLDKMMKWFGRYYVSNANGTEGKTE